SEGSVDWRHPARVAAAAARARAGSRFGDDPRGHRRCAAEPVQGPGRADRSRAAGAWPHYLPPIPNGEGRAAGDQPDAGARDQANAGTCAHRTGAGAGARTVTGPGNGVEDRRRAGWSIGTARALVHTNAPSASMAIVYTRAAAHWGAVAQ